MTGTKLRYEEVAEIIRLIDASACEEVVIETSELKLIVRRRGTGSSGAATSPVPITSNLSPAATADPGPVGHAPATAGRPDAAPSAVGSGIEIRAPMVGTFYRAPAPDKPPFVEIGSIVKKGDPLCVIEVMKLFTTVFAEAEGRVIFIGVENAAPVEYGQLMFVLEPIQQP